MLRMPTLPVRHTAINNASASTTPVASVQDVPFICLIRSCTCGPYQIVITVAQKWHDVRYRKRAFAISDRAMEAYIRDDIPCGHPLCRVCKTTRPQLSKTATHLLIPDASTLESYLEVFQLPDVHSVVFLSSVIRKVSNTAAMFLL